MGADAKRLGSMAADSLPPPNRLNGYKGGGSPEPDEDDGAAADEELGAAFAEAVASKDGAAITRAFRDLSDHCGG